MKKIKLLFIALIASFCLCACGNNNTNTEDTSAKTTESITTSTDNATDNGTGSFGENNASKDSSSENNSSGNTIKNSISDATRRTTLRGTGAGGTGYYGDYTAGAYYDKSNSPKYMVDGMTDYSTADDYYFNTFKGEYTNRKLNNASTVPYNS